jgi:hypothetical protein
MVRGSMGPNSAQPSLRESCLEFRSIGLLVGVAGGSGTGARRGMMWPEGVYSGEYGTVRRRLTGVKGRSLVLVLALSGCTGPPADGPSKLEDNAVAEHRFAGYAYRLDGAHEPVPQPAPETELAVTSIQPSVIAKPRVELVIAPSEVDEDPELFEFSVSARDVPAIDVADGTVVVPELEILQLTTARSGFGLAWFSTTTGQESLRVVSAREWPSKRELKDRVREINGRLGERSWRKMEPLPVEFMSPDDDAEYYKERMQPHERPVQVLVQRGELIVRILGVRVLERHEIGSGPGTVHSLYADRQTAMAVAVFTWCTGEDCTCDPVFTVELMQFDPATLEAIDRHPCVGECGPVDYGYAGIEPWG